MSSLAIIARNAECQALSDLLDGGYFQVRNGTQPAGVADTATGTLIATVTLNTPSFLTPSAGAMNLDTPAAVVTVADASSSNITWGRFYDSSNNAVLDVSITVFGGGGEVIATKVDPGVGETVGLTFTYSIPE